jgi:polyhydroxybutyrate depolymerase
MELRMQSGLLLFISFLFAHPQLLPLGAGEHLRHLTQGELKRSYLVHIPPSYDGKKPMPVVVVLHGAAMNGPIMEWFCGLSKKADEAGFIAVYPDGTGPGGTFLTWNAGVFPGKLNPNRPDDVAFIGQVLDSLAAVVRMDRKRVYAAGISNGAMMAYRLAAEMPERFAAIAAIAGVLCVENPDLKQPMPILHFHGTKDGLVPFEGTKGPFRFPSVMENLAKWLKVNGCSETPKVTELPAKDEKLRVIRKDYNGGDEKAPVVLYMIEGGGHTWPGMQRHALFLGATAMSISANDLMWEFFRQFALK